MIIRKTENHEIDSVMPIFDEARGTMAKLGIDQWQDGYPTRDIIENLSRSYVVEIDGEICGTYVLQEGGDKNYDVIESGEWLTGNDSRAYLAIHRVAIAVKTRGCGIAERIMSYAADFARERALTSLRIDTHEGNVVMRRMLEKNKFTYCGIIFLENGDARVAYERKI